jgi:hypothetical protein
MEKNFKNYAFAFLTLRLVIDLILAGVIYYQEQTFVISFGFLLLCGVFYLLMFFGFRNEEFRGRYGQRVILWREPVGYWIIVAFLAIFHLVITILFARMVHW